jgi:hypothetical protein
VSVYEHTSVPNKNKRLTFEDIQRVKILDNRSANSIVNEGIRLVVKKKMEELSTLRKNRTSLQNMVSV